TASDGKQRRSEAQALSLYNNTNRRRTTPNATTVINAINNTDANAERLFVHLAGESAANGELLFALDNMLSAEQLDDALDQFQSRANSPEVIVIIDGVGAGSF